MNGGYREYYLRDAQGNVMAMYKYAENGMSRKVTERPIYGSKRLGSYTRQMELMGEPAMHQWPYTQPMQAPLKRYELTDHLGNVAAVVTGRLLPGNGSGASKQAELVSAQGYEPFGSLLPGRNFSSDSYRFGFQGQEKDDEIHGATGTSYSYTYRMHDARVGRFLSIDPLAAKYPHNSPYAFSENRVIDGVELEGLEVDLSAGKLTPHEYENNPLPAPLVFWGNLTPAIWNPLVDLAELTINALPPYNALNDCAGYEKIGKDFSNLSSKGYNWVANTSGEQKVQDLKAVATNPHTYEGIAGGLILGRMLPGGGSRAPAVGLATEATTATVSTNHIVLGLRANGLEGLASRIGAKHLLSDANWRSTLQGAVADPYTSFSVSIDGFAGATPYAKLMGAAQRGAAFGAQATEWEMSQLYQAGRLGEATIWENGVVIPNPLANPTGP